MIGPILSTGPEGGFCPLAEEAISLERRCQVAGCRTVFIAPSVDELRCPACRSTRRRPSPSGRSLHGCSAARCAGI